VTLPKIRKVLTSAAEHANEMSKDWNIHTGLGIWWLANACLASFENTRQEARLEYESKYAAQGKCDTVENKHCEVEGEAKSIMNSAVSSLIVF
jgi:hypothetical protein